MPPWVAVRWLLLAELRDVITRGQTRRCAGTSSAFKSHACAHMCMGARTGHPTLYIQRRAGTRIMTGDFSTGWNVVRAPWRRGLVPLPRAGPW